MPKRRHGGTRLREEFPDIKDSHATAVAELEDAATLLSPPERLEVTHLSLPVCAAVPAGIPLVARDAYGSRFRVAMTAHLIGKQAAHELPDPTIDTSFRHQE